MNTSTSPLILTTQQMQMADQYTIKHGLLGSELMEAAGQAVASASNRLKLDGGRVVIIVGIGNNAGDGFAAARLLRLKRVAVTVIPLFPLEQFKPETTRQADLAIQVGVKVRPALASEDLPILEAWLKRAVVVVDAIFGTGLTRPLSDWQAEAIACINECQRPILAVDIPSGIHSDSGEILGAAIQASATLPIAAHKWGHWLQQGKKYSGHMLDPASIGIKTDTLLRMQKEHPIAATQSQLIDLDVVKKAFPKRNMFAYKQTFGHVWIHGGSVGFTGAPKLAASGAQGVGAGLVSIACPSDVYPILAASSLEVMVHPQGQENMNKASALVVGPGWGLSNINKLSEALNHDIPVVMDADALNMLANHRELHNQVLQRPSLTVLTPHPGEAGRLLSITSSEVQKDRLAAAIALVDQYKTWVVLKGPQTLIVSPNKQVWLNPFGSAKLAVAGTGDVLAGMIGGLLASGLAAEVSIPAAVGLHGLAGEKQHWHRAGQLENIIAEQVQSFQT
ncbi:MAG: NAD(P)H-hydrate dehydratase [Ghiorsea sp.]